MPQFAKRLEPELSDERFHHLVDAVVDYAIYMLDLDGHVTSWNAGAQRVKGYRADEIIGKHFSLFYTEEDRASGKPQRVLDIVRKTGRWEDESWRVRKDGTRFWANVVVSALRDAKGEVIGFAKVTRDLTERRAAEENARRLAEESAARRAAETNARQLQLLAEASRVFADAKLDVQGTIDAVANHCARILGDLCAVQMVTGADTFEVRAFADRDPAAARAATELFVGAPLLLAESFGGRAILRGEPMRVSTEPSEFASAVNPKTRAFIEKFPVYHAVAIPFRSRGRIIGAVTMSRHSKDAPYTDDDIALLQDVADRAGLAVDNARLFQTEVELRHTAEGAVDRTLRLQSTTAALARAMTAKDAGDAVLREGTDHFRATAGIVYLLDETTDRLEAICSLHASPSRMATYSSVSMSIELPATSAVKIGAPIYLERLADLVERFPALREVDMGATQASMTLPLVADALRGSLVLTFANERTFSPEDRSLAEAIAQQCAQALERTMLLERDRIAAERSQLLAEATEIFASSLDPEATLARFAEVTVPRLADWCSIEVRGEGGKLVQAAVAHVDPEKVRWAKALRQASPPTRDPERGVLKVIRTGVPELYPEFSPEMVPDEAGRKILRQIGMRSAMCVPITSHETIGAITLCWAETPRRYGPSDLAFATDLAHRAGIALENARLYRALEDAVRVRDDFLAIAGHELKTPLAALMLQLQSAQSMFERGVDPQRIRERMQKVTGSVERLDLLIHQLLDVAQIASGRIQMHPEPMNISEMIAEVVDRFSDSSSSRSVIRSTIEPDIVGTWEPLRIDQVLTNLVTNAIKYGDGKPIDVSLSRQGDEAVVEIVDHGIGIAPEQQEKIFERFERAVSSRDFGGFGLGLWISRQITEANGGTIAVKSALGKGSTFTVRLPLKTS